MQLLLDLLKIAEWCTFWPAILRNTIVFYIISFLQMLKNFVIESLS